MAEEVAEIAGSSVDPKEQLQILLASASHQYALKQYSAASDLYAQAAEVQDLVNGEMNPANAELLYAYGRCLHHLAVSKSDVLGGKVAGPAEGGASAQKAKGKKRKREGAGEGSSSAAALNAKDDTVAGAALEKVVEEKDGTIVKEQEAEVKENVKPFFQISGDNDEWESDDEDADEDDGDAADAEAEEEEDDLAIAYETLDTARILLNRQIDGFKDAQTEEAKKEAHAVKERLADTYDLLAEISLENERFGDAVPDARQALALKEQLYDATDGLVSEAHYKLSLALEFASVTTPRDGNGEPLPDQQQVDEKMREEAASQMEAAIACTKERMKKEVDGMKELKGEELRKKEAERKDFEEIVADMQQRLEDLKMPPVSMSAASGPAGATLEGNPLGGILGEMLGEGPAAFKARIEEASKGANDLSGLVKHKKGKAAASTATESDNKGKRKATDNTGEEERSDIKRAKTPADAV